jgi:hypothetical protein
MAEIEIVEVTVILTREDYTAALRVLNEPSSWPKRILFWISVVTLGYFFYTWLRLADRPPLAGILGLLGIAIFVLVIRYGVPFLSARAFVKKNPDKLGPVKHSIGPDGASYESSHGDGKTKWTAYLRIRETPRFFLLYTQSNFAQILPKRCFDSPDEVERYRQVLRAFYKGKLELLP